MRVRVFNVVKGTGQSFFFSAGDVLYSNRSNPMFSISTDTAGSYIIQYAPCSQRMFEKSYGIEEPHPNCLDNLANGLRDYGITPSQITVPFNIFMAANMSPNGEIEIKPAMSKPGDYIDLKAKMDMVVAVTSRSTGLCNHFKWTPIELGILDN